MYAHLFQLTQIVVYCAMVWSEMRAELRRMNWSHEHQDIGDVYAGVVLFVATILADMVFYAYQNTAYYAHTILPRVIFAAIGFDQGMNTNYHTGFGKFLICNAYILLGVCFEITSVIVLYKAIRLLINERAKDKP